MVDGTPEPSLHPARSAARAGSRAHIRDVARLAGVSHQTVSRVINDHPMVRPETRQRVRDAIRTLDYRPSVSARALNTGRTGALGVVTPDSIRYGPVSMLHGIADAALHAGYLVSTITLRAADRDSLAAALDRLHEQAVDGIIVIASQDPLRRALAEMPHPVPLVTLHHSFDERTPAVSVDDVGGAATATRHLLDLGHATVWHLAGPAGFPATHDRVDGWRSALADAGAPVPEPVAGDWSADSGYRLGRRLARRADVTAVFAANDQMALGLLRALHEAGRRVPRDVAVVGFDDIPEAKHLLPPLTTMRPNFAAIGRMCLDAVLDELTGAARTTPRRQVAARLVIRDSCGAPPRRPRARPDR